MKFSWGLVIYQVVLEHKIWSKDGNSLKGGYDLSGAWK